MKNIIDLRRKIFRGRIIHQVVVVLKEILKERKEKEKEKVVYCLIKTMNMFHQKKY